MYSVGRFSFYTQTYPSLPPSSSAPPPPSCPFLSPQLPEQLKKITQTQPQGPRPIPQVGQLGCGPSPSRFPLKLSSGQPSKVELEKNFRHKAQKIFGERGSKMANRWLRFFWFLLFNLAKKQVGAQPALIRSGMLCGGHAAECPGLRCPPSSSRQPSAQLSLWGFALDSA